MTQAARSSGQCSATLARGRPDSADPPRMDRNPAGVGLSRPHRPRTRRRRTVSSGERPRRTLWGTAGARQSRVHVVARNADGAEREARIFLAAPLRHADLEEYFSAQIRDHAEIVWDDRGAGDSRAARAPAGRPAVGFDRDSQSRQPSPAECRAHGPSAVGAGRLAVDPGVAAVAGTRQLDGMRPVRVAIAGTMRRIETWRYCSELRDCAAPWMYPALPRREHFSRMDLGQMPLRSRLTYARKGDRGTRSAHAFSSCPSGSTVPDRLLGRRDPDVVRAFAGNVRIESRRPSVAAGRLPLLLNCCRPARRPVQITADARELLESRIP